MSRVKVVAAVASAAISLALASCSSAPDWMPSMPDFMSTGSSAPQLQNLTINSDPPGADVRTLQGQTCITPCTLAVPTQEQPVTISRIGYVPQTVQIALGPQPDHSFWENPPQTLVPNPVQVVLQAVPPPPKPIYRRRHRTISRRMERTRTATTAHPPRAGNPFPDPAPMQPASSPFPPPPPQQPAGSPFPPPPATQ